MYGGFALHLLGAFPPPLWGRVREGGRRLGRGRRRIATTPTPGPSPQGGGGRGRCALITFIPFDPENPRQLGRGLSQLGIVAVGRLRHLAETAGCRLAGSVGGREVGAPVARIVGRRLQAGLRADARLAAIDRRVEQVGERRPDRNRRRPRRLGAGRPGRILWLFRLLRLVGGFRHLGNTGGTIRRRKGGGFRKVQELIAFSWRFQAPRLEPARWGC